MSREVRDKSELGQWIAEIERYYSVEKHDAWDRLACLMEGLIREHPEMGLHFLNKYKEDGIRCIPNLKDTLNAMIREFLTRKDIEKAEDVLKLGNELEVAFDGVLLGRLAALYAQCDNYEKARSTLSTALEMDSKHADALRMLYNLAKRAGNADEAHRLLSQLVQVDGSAVTVSFAYRERSKLSPSSGKAVRIAVLSSYVLDQFVGYLDFECRKVHLAPQFYLAPYNQYNQEVLDSSSRLYSFNPEVIFVALAMDDLFPGITGFPSLTELEDGAREVRGQVIALARQLEEKCNALIVVHGFSLSHRSPHGILDNKVGNGLGKWMECLNGAISDEFRSSNRVYVLPLDHVLSWVGKERSNNPKMKYMARMKIGEAALPELAKYSMRYIKPLKGLTRKCVVVDLDGTLWGGIVGEVGPDGILLGPTAPGLEYMDFQRALQNLSRRGILLALCSKNNPDDALEVIRNHKYMVLREDDFSAMRINWANKADNIREIAHELTIGLDSIVFIDDNPAERELIRQLLPEVLTLDLPTDPSRYRTALEEISDFELFAVTREDEERAAQYQAIRKRRVLRDSAASLEGYLQSLEIRAEISFAGMDNLHRLVQMFNKTNQFNVTTRRYQAAEITQFLNSQEYLVYALEVRDRFGDHGIVGVAVIQKGNHSWRIDSLLISCRVLGLSIETAFLHRIFEDAREVGAKALVGEFIPTKKNQPAKDFYFRHGLRLVNEVSDCQIWSVDITRYKVQCPEWITVGGRHHDS